MGTEHSGLTELERLWAIETARIQRSVEKSDALMLQALQGGPFWGVGKPAGAEVRGLSEFLPVRRVPISLLPPSPNHDPGDEDRSER
jgi:hypothetical protein